MLGISKAIVAAIALLGLAVAAPAVADDHRTAAPEGAEVYFITPETGFTVKNPVTIKFGLRGMGVDPAGTEKEKTGHHHLLVNKKLENYAESIPSDKNHIHFGGGQTEVTLELPVGTHTLQLVLGDHNHIPHIKPVESEVITITVQ